MSLFFGSMRQHIEGFKNLTDHKSVVDVPAGKLVYIPMYATHSTKFDMLVQEGDRVFVGTKVAQCNERMVVPVFSSVSGVVKGVQKIMHSSLKPVDHIVIENDFKYETQNPFSTLDYKTASREELIEFMKNAGIVGCGGACFPAYIKYQFAKDIEMVIVNAVECEPYITADYRMVNEYLKDMVTGIQAVKKMADAKKVLIAIKHTKKDLIAQLEEAVKDLEGVEVRPVPDVYPMGWERTLVKEITGKTYDRLPGEVGCIVNNASTIIAFADALTEATPIVEKIITVSGDGIKEPANVKVRVGTPVCEIIETIGGYTSDNVLLIAGGPMMGKTIVNDKFVIDRAMNALTVFNYKEVESVSCLRCGRCSDNCPSGLQPVRIAQAVNTNNIDAMIKLDVMSCVECGLCTYVCPSKLTVTENVRKAKRQVMLKTKK